MTTNLYFEDVELGQETTPCARKTDFMSWNRYAAAHAEFVRLIVPAGGDDHVRSGGGCKVDLGESEGSIHLCASEDDAGEIGALEVITQPPRVHGVAAGGADGRHRAKRSQAGSAASAEQKHRLLAEQIPEPPRRVEAQRRAPGVEGDGTIHLGAGYIT